MLKFRQSDFHHNMKSVTSFEKKKKNVVFQIKVVKLGQDSRESWLNLHNIYKLHIRIEKHRICIASSIVVINS